MGNKKKIFLTICTVIGIGLIFNSSNIKDKDLISHAALGGGMIDLVTAHWDNGNGTAIRSTSLPPTYITFNEGTTQKAQYDALGISKIWEEFHQNKFLWYSIAEPNPYKKTDSNTDMSKMVENRVVRANTDYAYLLKNQTGIWQNIKSGSFIPGRQDRDSYQGANSGTTKVTNKTTLASYYGQFLEFRYLGYAENGAATFNPYFPADYPVDHESDWQPETKSWWVKPWEETDGHVAKVSPSPYDTDDPETLEQKIQWFITYFFPEHPEFRRQNVDLWTDAAYWANRFSLANDPSVSTGIVTGWHGSGYYASFTLKTPPQPNLRVVNYTVTNKKTGEVVGKMTMDASNNSNIYQKYDVNNKEVKPGDVLVISATVKNMVVPELGSHTTSYSPIRMVQMASYDDNSNIYGKWDDFQPVENVIPTSNSIVNTIGYGDSLGFSQVKNSSGQVSQWEFTVPQTVKKEFVLATAISHGFYLAGDNYYTDDDIGRIRFKVKENVTDIGVSSNDVELVDQFGNVTTEIIPYRTYTLRFKVTKFKGDNPIGEIGNYYNPFAAISVTASDMATQWIEIDKAEATQTIIDNGDKVVIEIKDAITPTSSRLKLHWKIHWFNASPLYGNQSSDTSNDEAYKDYASTNNLSVDHFTIKPSSITSPFSSTKEMLTFDFNVRNDNAENKTKATLIEIRDSSGGIVKSETVNLPANKDLPLTWTVNNVNIHTDTTGADNTFTVELNRNRAWLELREDGQDPYQDNIAQNAVKGYLSSSAPPCLAVHTSNNWSITHYLNEWSGHLVSGSYWVTTYTNNKATGGYWQDYSYCETDSSSSWSSTIAYHETYKITKVMFRSKLTKDKYGGDGWIDVMNQPGQVKAGYGFEIKYIVQYETNTYSASPKSWYTTCSGKSVYPSVGSSVTSPSVLYVKMPFKDAYGSNVSYTLSPSDSSGSWDDMTRTYEMPIHTISDKSTREVFVNETAKDGNYTMNIQTYPYFYGSYDKPSTANYLCDSKNIIIQVVGANSDDIKSHITQ